MTVADERTFLQRVADRQNANRPAPTSSPTPTPITYQTGDGEDTRRRAYAQAALTDECAKVTHAAEGTRNDTLNRARFALARFIDDGLLAAEHITDSLTAAARTAGLTDTEIRATLRSATAGAAAKPRTQPAVPPARANGHVTEVNGTELGAQPPAGREIRWTTGDQIDTAVPVWAWAYGGRGRIQIGTLALFAGRPGAGKSTAARWFAAQATRGSLEGCWAHQPQNVAYIAAEESARYTIGPGLLAAGADMSRIHFPSVYHDGQAAQLLSILDEQALSDYCLQRGIRVVIVDPLMSTITGTADINKNNEVRAQVAPWSRIADRIDGITLGVAHLRKSGTGDVVAAVTGSSAFGELARAVFGFAKNHENDTRVMSQHKNSTGYEDLSVTYQIESETVLVASGETAEVGTFVITGDSEITVEDILSDSTMGNGANLECQRWLEDYLTQQGASASKEVKAEAHKAIGVSASSVERAAKKLKVIVESNGFPRRTYWSMPDAVTSADPSQPRQQSRHE